MVVSTQVSYLMIGWLRDKLSCVNTIGLFCLCFLLVISVHVAICRRRQSWFVWLVTDFKPTDISESVIDDIYGSYFFTHCPLSVSAFNWLHSEVWFVVFGCSLCLVLNMMQAILLACRFVEPWQCIVNSSTPRVAYIHQWTGSSLVQIMACRLLGAKPFTESVLGYCELDFWEQISVKFESDFHQFSIKKMHLIMSSANIVAILSTGEMS